MFGFPIFYFVWPFGRFCFLQVLSILLSPSLWEVRLVIELVILFVWFPFSYPILSFGNLCVISQVLSSSKTFWILCFSFIPLGNLLSVVYLLSSKSWVVAWYFAVLSPILIKVYESFGFPKVSHLASKVFECSSKVFPTSSDLQKSSNRLPKVFKNMLMISLRNAHVEWLVFEWGALGALNALLYRVQNLKIS